MRDIGYVVKELKWKCARHMLRQKEGKMDIKSGSPGAVQGESTTGKTADALEGRVQKGSRAIVEEDSHKQKIMKKQ